MPIDALKDQIQDFAKDIRLNIGNVLTPEGAPDLNETQIFTTALAAAYATRHTATIDAITSIAAPKLSEADINAAKAAATLMAMNNIYYRFTGFLGEDDIEYHQMKVNLRMNVIANPGVAKEDFELYSLAVSALGGCHFCVKSHAKLLEKSGFSKVAIQSAARIAAVVNAVATALEIGAAQAAPSALAA